MSNDLERPESAVTGDLERSVFNDLERPESLVTGDLERSESAVIGDLERSVSAVPGDCWLMTLSCSDDDADDC